MLRIQMNVKQLLTHKISKERDTIPSMERIGGALVFTPSISDLIWKNSCIGNDGNSGKLAGR